MKITFTKKASVTFWQEFHFNHYSPLIINNIILIPPWQLLLVCWLWWLTASYWVDRIYAHFTRNLEIRVSVKSQAVHTKLKKVSSGGNDSDHGGYKMSLYSDIAALNWGFLSPPQDESRVKVTVMEVQPVDHRDYSRRLLSNIRRLARWTRPGHDRPPGD